MSNDFRRMPADSRSMRPLRPNSTRIQPLKPDEMQSFQNDVYPWKMSKAVNEREQMLSKSLWLDIERKLH